MSISSLTETTLVTSAAATSISSLAICSFAALSLSYTVSTYTVSTVSASAVFSSIGWPENVTVTFWLPPQISESKSWSPNQRLISNAITEDTDFPSSVIRSATVASTSSFTREAVAVTPSGSTPSSALIWMVTPSTSIGSSVTAGWFPFSVIATSTSISPITSGTEYHTVLDPSSLSSVVSASITSPFTATLSTA